MREREAFYPDFPKVNFPHDMTLLDFDSICTAPEGGYKDALDYYKQCSAKFFIKYIGVDARIVFAKDDPLICSEQLDGLNYPKNVKVYKTERGGHLGHVARKKDGGFHWMDRIIADWVAED